MFVIINTNLQVRLLSLETEVLLKFHLKIYFSFYKLNISEEILVVIIIHEKCEYRFVYKRIL